MRGSAPKKLWIFTIRALCNSRRHPSFALSLLPRVESSRVSRVSCGCDDYFYSFPTVSRRNLCLKPEDGAIIRCWNCGTVAESTPFLACQSCKSVQPVDQSVDYFQIFGLREKGYEIADENLEKKYKDWQKKLHPDLVHSKSEEEKAYAAEQSARVIDAYRTLSKPLSRAMYLLQLEGIHVDEEKTVSDPELLAEIMEIRETVDEANDLQALNRIKMQILRTMESWSKSLGNAFRRRDFESAKTSIQRMTYYERAIEEIGKKL